MRVDVAVCGFARDFMMVRSILRIAANVLRLASVSMLFVLFVLRGASASLITILEAAILSYGPSLRLLVAGVGVSTLFGLFGSLAIGIGSRRLIHE
jgi:hypothetical protein